MFRFIAVTREPYDILEPYDIFGNHYGDGDYDSNKHCPAVNIRIPAERARDNNHPLRA